MIEDLDFSGRSVHNEGFNKIFVHGHGSDLFLAVGCSWTRAWGASDSCLAFGSKDFADDPVFMLEKSYAGRLAQHLNFGFFINMAMPGSSMDLQARFMIEFLQKNRHKFNRVFVLWGMTSHLRWELYVNDIDIPMGFQIGSNVPKEAASYYRNRNDQMMFFLRHHWNEDFELARYSQKIVMCHAYLRMLQADHLFFPTFESFSQHNMNLNHVDDRNFFSKDLKHNSMLDFWWQQIGRKCGVRVSSNPFDTSEHRVLEPLIDAGFLSERFAHPTEQAHLDIFTRLVNHLESNQAKACKSNHKGDQNETI